MRKLSSAASAANAACDHIYDWLVGTAPGDIASMAVVSDGSYGVPEGLVFSYPVTCNNGDFHIVQGLKVKFNFEGRELMKIFSGMTLLKKRSPLLLKNCLKKRKWP